MSLTPVSTLSGPLSSSPIKITGTYLAIRFFTDSAVTTTGWNVTVNKYLDGGWTLWSNYGTCQGVSTCPDTNGTSTRTRSCTNPAPWNGGLTCSGAPSETISCNITCNYFQASDVNYTISVNSTQYLNNINSFWYMNTTANQTITGYNLRFLGSTEVKIFSL